MVIWLSGLQTIPGELYEAASIDGANPWQQFAYVTWPGLRQTATFILITITISAFALFSQVNIMTQGGPSTPPRHWSSRPSAPGSNNSKPDTPRPSRWSSSSWCSSSR